MLGKNSSLWYNGGNEFEHMKKFIEYFIAFGIAFMVFLTMILSENAHFQKIEIVKNPFPDIDVHQIIETKTEEKEVFTSLAELFILSPESKINLASQNREILSGKVFVSFSFLNDQIPQKIEIPVSEQNRFTSESYIPTVGQLRVGPLVINAPGSNLLILRNPDQAKSEIYVFGHSAEVFFDGAKHPFVIPSGKYITVKESLITPKTESLFHSKLKKEWRMRSFVIPSIPTSNTPEDIFASGMKKQSLWKNKIQSFALTVPESWNIAYKDSWGSSILQGIQKIQNKFAFGLSQEAKDRRILQTLLKPFVKTHFLIKERKSLLAGRTIQEFNASLENADWKNILSRNLTFNDQWNLFFRAHIGWLQTISPGDMGEVFQKFWLDRFSSEDFEKTKKTFSDVEILLSNKSYRRAEKVLKEFQEMLEKTEITKSNRFQLTKMRRILVEILKQESLFQTEEMFNLYKTFVAKEVSFQEDSEWSNEIYLESAQDILFFLHTFLEDKSKINISRVLLRTYNFLKIEEILERMGRGIFTAKENEMISLISLIGNTGITQEELDAIQNAKAYQDELDKQIQELQSKKEEKNPVIQDPNFRSVIGIQNARNLKEFFEKNNIDTQKMTFKTIRSEYTTQFSQGYFDGKKVSGNFQYDIQIFPEITIGDNSQKDIHKRFFPGFLAQTKEEISSDTIIDKEPDIFISQTTPRAILERKLIQELLELEGFSVSLEDIEIQDETMKNIKIHEALLEGKYKTSFLFSRNTEVITGVMLSFEKNKIDFGKKEFPMENVGKIFMQEISGLFEIDS
jgi:hypothetical protein